MAAVRMLWHTLRSFTPRARLPHVRVRAHASWCAMPVSQKRSASALDGDASPLSRLEAVVGATAVGTVVVRTRIECVRRVCVCVYA